MIVDLPSVRSVCWHESAHLSSLALDGQTPLSVQVDVWSRAPGGVMGRMRGDWETHELTKKTVTAQLIAVLMGPLQDAEGEPQIDICTWPIQPDLWRTDGNQSDGRQAKALADWLKLDLIGWQRIVFKAFDRSKDRRFRKLMVAFSRELEESGELFKPEIDAIAERVLSDEPT